MARIIFKDRQELDVFIDPQLNVVELPRLIAQEAERVAAGDVAVLRAEACLYFDTTFGFEKDQTPCFRLKLHTSDSHSSFGTSYNEEYVAERGVDGQYSIRHNPREKSRTMPCH